MIVPTSEQIEAIRAFAEQVAAFLRNYDVAVRQPDGSAAFVRLDLVAEEVLKMAAAYEADEGPSSEHPLLFTCPFGDGLKFAFHTQAQVDMLERHLKVAHGREWISVEERLPEEPDEDTYGEYLITYFNGDLGPFTCAAKWQGGMWWEEVFDSDLTHLKITHWKEFPAPAQQESEANHEQ